jgi:phosphoglycolate phosphatase
VAYRLIIFDFDGTLADSFPWFLSVFDRMADRHGFSRLDRSRMEELRALSAREMIARQRVPAWKLPTIAADMRRWMAEDAHQISLFEGAGEMLGALKASGLTLAVVTSNSEANVRAILGPENVARIDHYACGASMFGKKAKLRQVLKASGVAAAEALSVGEKLRDATPRGRPASDLRGCPGATPGRRCLARALVLVFDNPAEVRGGWRPCG